MAASDKSWLVTGASSGLGSSLVDRILQEGGTVVGTFRKAEQCAEFETRAPGRSHAVQMDVTDAAQVKSAVAEALAKAGRIDVLVNNAGYALCGVIEQVSDEEAWHQLDTNVMGILRVTREVLPAMRKQGSGRIMNISSIAGSIGYPNMGLYSASKHAVLGLTEALAQEVAALGIKVISIEPGGFRTKFGSSSMASAKATAPEPYVPMIEGMSAAMAQFEANMPGNPDLAATRLMELAELAEPPMRVALGDDAMPAIRQALQQRIAVYEEAAPLGQGTSDR